MKGFGSYFWGIFLIGVGLLMIVKYQFKLNIPLFKVVAGIFFLALGLSTLLGGFGIKSNNDIVFSEGIIQAIHTEKDYNIVFSNGTIDLSDIDVSDGSKKVQVNVVFSNGIVKVNPDITTTIKINAAFASANTPDGSMITFGEHTYHGTGRNQDNRLIIEASVVFGKVEFVTK